MLRFKNTTDDSPKGMYISPFAFGKIPGGNLANLRFTLRSTLDIPPEQKDIQTSSDINKLSEIFEGILNKWQSLKNNSEPERQLLLFTVSRNYAQPASVHNRRK